MKRRLGAGAAIVALGVVGVAALALRSGGDDDSTARVVREDFEVVIEAPGRLEAAVAFEIGPPSVRDFWRYDLSWMIPEGKVVQAGEVVARIPTGRGPFSLAYVDNPELGIQRVYVTHFYDHSVGAVEVDPMSPYFQQQIAEIHGGAR